MATAPEANLTRDGLQQRFFELRFDGERKLSGVVMRYGDEYRMPWGETERFEPGAFGEVGGLDVILNKSHDRSAPIARTGGGGLSLSDSPSELRMEAAIPETKDGDDTLTLVRAKILRGLSVEFHPDENRIENAGSRENVTIIHTKVNLRGIGVVDRPAFTKSTVEARQAATKQESPMSEKDIKKIVDDALERAGGPPLDSKELVTSLSGEIRSQLDSALEERDKAAADKAAAEARAEEDRAAAEAAAKAVDDAHKAELEQVRASAERVASLRAKFASLMPEGEDLAGKSAMDILVLAVGKEVEKPEERSGDYLEAKAEAILERREEAANRRGAPAPRNRGPQGAPATGSPVNVVRMIERRSARRASAQGG